MRLISKLRRPKENAHGSSQGSGGISSTPATSTPNLISTPATSSTTLTAKSSPEQAVPSVPQPLNPATASLSTSPLTQPAVSDATSSTSNGNIDPWTRAYEIFQNREPELMADYKTHLASLQDDHAYSADLSTPRSVESIVKQLLEDREKKQWRVPLLRKDIKIREQAERLAKFLLWADPVVKTAVSPQPYAALAWSGVTLLLPVGI